MSSTTDYRYRINGVVSTDKTVLQNLETLCSAAGSWLSYDSHEGKWAIVINGPGTSIASFNDSNIVGPITISGSGLTDIYNSVKVEFPHIDLNDQKDYIFDSIPEIDRNANEPDNILNIQYDIVNDPVQAEYLGLLELKQSRVDQIIKFRSDFSTLGLKAGDLIDVTSSTYGFSNKVYRVIKVSEQDDDSGAIYLDITALEYDANVYSTDDLYRYVRTNSTGISTIGNIGAPGAPIVNKFENDARPRVEVTSTSPTGIVEALEFWYSNSDAVLDSNRNYTLLSTVKPIVGNTFNYGTTISASSDSIVAGNLHIKTRGINSTTVGPFSTPTGFVYTPLQTTQAISDTTVASNGNGLLTTLTVLSLLSKVDGLFTGDTGVGGLFGKVMDLINPSGNIAATSSALGNLVVKASTIPKFATFQVSSTTGYAQSQYNAYAGSNPGWGDAGEFDGISSDPTDQIVVAFTLTDGATQLQLTVNPPQAQYDINYIDYLGSEETRRIYAYVPSFVQLRKNGTLLQSSTSDWQTNNLIFNMSNAPAGNYEIWMRPLPTYDLDQQTSFYVWPYNFTVSPQASGGGATVTAIAFKV